MSNLVAAMNKIDPLDVQPWGVFDLPGMYAGWDGRHVKFGIAGSSGGLRSRLRAYATHNPSFNVLAYVPASELGVSDYDQLQQAEAALLARVGDSVLRRETSTGVRCSEWCNPTACVVYEVRALRGLHDAIVGDAERLRRCLFESSKFSDHRRRPTPRRAMTVIDGVAGVLGESGAYLAL